MSWYFGLRYTMHDGETMAVMALSGHYVLKYYPGKVPLLPGAKSSSGPQMSRKHELLQLALFCL